MLSAFCETYGTVLAVPLFTRAQYGDYQRLGRTGLGKRSDLALNLMAAEVASSTGAVADRFYLFGFSGGAQFAHRYAMAHPHRVAGAVFASAGWYTLPDARRRYPYGTRPSNRLPGVRFDAEEFLCVPMTVLVGANDDTQQDVRRNPRLDRAQGVNRIERARSWVAAMKAAAAAHHLESMVTYAEIPASDHSFTRCMLSGDLGGMVFKALFGDAPAKLNPFDLVS